jgi:fatty acid amide hydrolase 2
VERGHRFAEELAQVVGDGVLLHPPLPRTAPRHATTYGRLLFFQPAGIFNVAGLPVTQVPLGLGRHGLPLGVQVAAGPQRDHVAIAVALELERRFGGWVRPAGDRTGARSTRGTRPSG